MNLLIVTADLPRPAWGASTRNFHMLKILARQHTLSLLSLVDRAEAGAYSDIFRLNDFTRSVQVIPRPTSHAKRRQHLKMREVLGTVGRELVGTEYSWERCCDRL
jgi:hypothetical protein